MEELETIVQRMIDAGETEENIKLAIEEYNKINVEKTQDSQKIDAPVESESTASTSADTSSELQKLSESKIDFSSELQPAVQSSTSVVPSMTVDQIQQAEKTMPSSPSFNYGRTKEDLDVDKLKNLLITPEKVSSVTGYNSAGVPTTSMVSKELSSEEKAHNDFFNKKINTQVKSSKEKLDAWASNEFFSRKDYVSSITQSKTLTGYEMEDQDKQDLKEAFKSRAMSGGEINKDFFPGLTAMDIDEAFESAFANQKNIEVALEKKADEDIAIQSGKNNGVSIEKNVENLNNIMKRSYGKPLEQQLAQILDQEEKIANNELRVEDEAYEKLIEKKNSLIDQIYYEDEYAGAFDPTTKSRIKTGRRVPKSTGGYSVFHDFSTGQNIQNPNKRSSPTGTADITGEYEIYLSTYKNTSREDLAKHNDRVLLEESGYNIEGKEIQSVEINDKSLRTLLAEYQRPSDGNVFDVPLNKLTELGYIANSWDFWSPNIYNPKSGTDEIKPVSFEGKPYSNEKEFIEYLEVRNKQGLDIAANKHALWQTYHLNRDITSINKTRVGQVFGAASDTFFGPEVTQEQFGFTNQKTIDIFTEEVVPASGIELSEDQERHTERTLGDKAYESVGSLMGLTPYLIGGNKVQGALGINKVIGGLRGANYLVKGRKVSKANAIKFASSKGKTIDELVTSGLMATQKATNWQKGQALVLGAVAEDIKMREGLGAMTDGRLAFERGVGAGFYLGGQLLPYSFKNKTKWNQLNTALELTLKNGPAFAIAAEAGEAINAVVDDVQGREEFGTFVKKHWGDYDENVERTILHLMTGAGLGMTHLKSFDVKTFAGIKNLKVQAAGKIIEAQKNLEVKAEKDGIDLTNNKAWEDWLQNEAGNKNKDLLSIEKYNEDFLMATSYLDKINELEEWTDPIKAKKHYENHYSDLKQIFKEQGKELMIEVGDKPLYQEYFDANGKLQTQEVSALFTRLSDVGGVNNTTTRNQARIQINVKKSKGKSTSSHEGLHAYMDLMFDGKPALKTQFANKLIDTLSNINLGTGINLYEEILKDPALAGKKQLQLEELMTYTAEFLSLKENRSLVQGETFEKIAGFFNNFSKSTTGKPADAFTQQDVINILGRFSAKGDYAKLKGLDKYVGVGESLEGKLASKPIETVKEVLERTEEVKKKIIQDIKDLNTAKPENYKEQIAEKQEALRGPEVNGKIDAYKKIANEGDPRNVLNKFLGERLVNDNFKNKYTKEDIKEGGVGRKDFNKTAELILKSEFVKNMITTNTGALTFKKGGPNEQKFYEDVMAKIQVRLEKNYDPQKNPDVFGWLTGVSGGASGKGRESIIFRAKGDVMLEAGKQVKTVSKEIIEGFDNMFSEGEGLSGESGPKEAPLLREFFTETVEYSNKALETIDNAVARENLNVDGLSYKDVKNLIAGQTLINGKVPTSAKNVEATGPLKDILEVVGEKHGIPLERILANQTLTSGMRDAARKIIFEEAKQKIDGLPEGTTPSGKSTGIANTKLGEFYVKGEAVTMADTGSKQGLPEQSKQDILKNDFLEMFGIKPDGTMIGGTKYDGAIREYLKQEASIIANQAVRSNKDNLAAAVGEGRGIKMASKELVDKLLKDLKSKGIVKATPRDFHDLVISKEYDKFEARDRQQFMEELSKLNHELKEVKHGAIEKLSVQEELAVRETQVKPEMEALEAGSYKDLVNETKKMFKNDKDISKLNTEEGLENWSDPNKNPNAAKDVIIQNKFDGSVLNQYNKDAVLADAQTVIMSTMYQGKVKRYNPKTGKMERMNLPSGNRTPDGYFDFHMNTKWTGTKADMSFLKNLKVVDTGIFKTKLAEFIEANKNAENLTELVWKEGRRLLTKKGTTYEAAVEAGKKAREFHLDAMREVVVNHGEYGLTRAEALQGYFRHLRAQTNITNGMLKGTATITSSTKMLGIPVGKNVNAKNYLGTMFHAEHQLQLLNFSRNISSALIKSGKNTAKYKELTEDLNDLFEQTIQTKQDQLIYDYGAGNTPTTFMKSFKGKKLGEVMSILNVMHRPGVVFETVDFKSSKPQTIGETLIENYSQKQVQKLLDLAAKTGELNSYANEVKIANNNRNSNSVTKQKLIELKLASKKTTNDQVKEIAKAIDQALIASKVKNKKSRGGSFFDFDDTLATTKSGIRYEMPNPSGKPQPNRKAILIAGNAGAGKTTIIDQLNLRKQGFKYVNQDIALDWLTKNSGLPKDMNEFTREQSEQWRDIGSKAAVAAKNKAYKLQGKGDGVVVDGTGSVGVQFQSMARDFKNAGYDVQVVFIESSLETAVARNKGRSERRLTDATIRNSVESAKKNKKAFKEMVTFFPYSAKGFIELNTNNLKQGEPLPADFVKKIDNFTKGYIKGRINAEQFASEGAKLLEQGAKYDFSEFNKVVEGAPGPLLGKAIERAKKFGNKDMYIVTARPAESAKPIHEFLKSQGLDIPIENITGLGNSTAEAKAIYMLKKFSEGYNDMYFVDDALQNVKAVKNVLDQLDIKSSVQQALASKDLNLSINKILEGSIGVESSKRFSKAEAAVRGKDIRRRRVFMTDGAADLELLIEPLYGKGKEGIKNKKWFEENFTRTWERGINDFNNARQAITNDYMNLRKQNKDIVKQLPEAVEGTNFTTDMAIRTYIWNKAGYKIPDLTPTSQAKLVKHIIDNPKLQAYAETVAKLTKVEGGLKEPSAQWWGETLATEIQDLGKGIGRKKYIQEFVDAKNEIFSEENLNKMESKLGTNWRNNIEEMFSRMETGRTRSLDLGKTGNAMMNYFNGSTGAIMNFNTRSAALQLISTVNFVNSSFNNPLAAAKAFADQPQYWKDFMTIMNSDMLKQRRAGLEINVTEAELASAAASSKNPAKAVIAKILKAGYLPTKIADSFAIASGGATYYRNAIKMYEKQGLSKSEAEKKAFIDFQATAERTQQSSRADLLSNQQTSFAGRIILPFANTSMQMNRIMVKDVLDISKGRYKGYYGEGSLTSKLSRIGYYGFAQSAIFAGLQSGAFALMTNSDDEKLVADAKLRSLNTMADSFLRGMGIQGAVINGFRLAIKEFIKQDGKKYNADYDEIAEKLLNISPTVGSKFSKLDQAGNTYNYNKKVIKEEGLTLNGPLMETSTQVIESLTNLPLNRYYRKGQNIQNALDDDYENWQRVLMGAGWSNWGLGVGDPKVINKGKENEYTKYRTKEDLRREELKAKLKKEEAEKKKKKKKKKSNKSRIYNY